MTAIKISIPTTFCKLVCSGICVTNVGFADFLVFELRAITVVSFPLLSQMFSSCFLDSVLSSNFQLKALLCLYFIVICLSNKSCVCKQKEENISIWLNSTLWI